jgi:hypothetical protein
MLFSEPSYRLCGRIEKEIHSLDENITSSDTKLKRHYHDLLEDGPGDLLALGAKSLSHSG